VSRFTSRRRSGAPSEQRFNAPAWPLFTFGGTGYPTGAVPLMSGTDRVEPDGSFASMVAQVHSTSGTVSAAVVARALLVSQLRFTWFDAASTNSFGDAELDVVNHPERFGGLHRSRLLFTAEEHVSYAGNAYVRRLPSGRLTLLNPQWTSVVIGSDADEVNPLDQGDAQVVGYLYRPGGRQDGPVQMFTTDEVVQWAPEPNPWCWWMGSSWVTSVLLEIGTDRQSTEHVSKFYEHAATPQLVFKFDSSVTQDAVKAYADAINPRHAGTANAYRNMFIGGGADVVPVGASLGQLDYSNTQGGFETRIATRSRVPAVVLGLREGMQGSALNAGNYGSTRRLWADAWFAPTSEGLATTLEGLLSRPSASTELVPDTGRVLFLQEDRKDQAEIHMTNANALRAMVDAGFDPASAADAIVTDDLRKLRHTGLYSVQLQPPMPDGPAAPEPARHETHLHLDERAVVVDVPVTIADGAVRGVTVEAPQVAVTVPERAVTVEAPQVTVEAPHVTVEAAEQVRSVRTIERDDQGNIARIIEE
jgi:hypothetical protein